MPPSSKKKNTMPPSPARKVFPSSSSSTSTTSSLSTTSDDLHSNTSINPVKFICSYGGRIVPRCPDGKLRYTGGQTRIITVDLSISFSELVKKLGETCGLKRKVVAVRCQIPSFDLDVLVSISSDEDLRNLIEEYEQVKADQGIKVRAFLNFLPPSPSVSPIHKSPTPILLSPPASKLGQCQYHNYHQHFHHRSLRGGGVNSAYKHQFHHEHCHHRHHCQQLVHQ